MNIINDIVFEDLKDHFKKHWKKYALGLGLGLGSAALAGGGGYLGYKKYKNHKSEIKEKNKPINKLKEFYKSNKDKIHKGLIGTGIAIGTAYGLHKLHKNTVYGHGLLNSYYLNNNIKKLYNSQIASNKIANLLNNQISPDIRKKHQEALKHTKDDIHNILKKMELNVKLNSDSKLHNYLIKPKIKKNYKLLNLLDII